MGTDLSGSITLLLNGAQATFKGEQFSWEDGGEDGAAHHFTYDENDDRVELSIDMEDGAFDILNVEWNGRRPSKIYNYLNIS